MRKGQKCPNYPKIRKSRPLKYNLIGKRFHYLTVLEYVSLDRRGTVTWKCKCDCGQIKIFSQKHLIRKHSPVKSCGCKKKATNKDHKDFKGYGEIPLQWWNSKVTREIFQRKRTSIPVNITIEYAWELFLKQNRRCAYTNKELKIANKPEENTASIDRIDSSKGYVKGNIQWVHKHVNIMKNIFTDQYFVETCKIIAQNK
jgi:hypothetical protein